jgi:hypothetical protein
MRTEITGERKILYVVNIAEAMYAGVGASQASAPGWISKIKVRFKGE